MFCIKYEVFFNVILYVVGGCRTWSDVTFKID